MTCLDDGEPLPIGVHLGGEASEDGMLRIAKDAQSARRDRFLVVLGDGLEHAVVPVVRLEESTYRQFRSLWHQQHALAFLQHIDSCLVQYIRNGNHTLQLT